MIMKVKETSFFLSHEEIYCVAELKCVSLSMLHYTKRKLNSVFFWDNDLYECHLFSQTIHHTIYPLSSIATNQLIQVQSQSTVMNNVMYICQLETKKLNKQKPNLSLLKYKSILWRNNAAYTMDCRSVEKRVSHVFIDWEQGGGWEKKNTDSSHTLQWKKWKDRWNQMKKEKQGSLCISLWFERRVLAGRFVVEGQWWESPLSRHRGFDLQNERRC